MGFVNREREESLFIGKKKASMRYIEAAYFRSFTRSIFFYIFQTREQIKKIDY